MELSNSGPSTLGGPKDDRFRIVHISDIHYGRHFSDGKWSKLNDWIAELCPDLIVITGDIVNSPWRRNISRVKKLLKELESRVPCQNDRPQLIRIVPGNHDTRVEGLFPVRLLIPLSILLAILSLVAFVLAADASLKPASLLGIFTYGVGAAFALSSLLAVILRPMLAANFVQELSPEYSIHSAELSKCARVGLVPIDSATRLTFFAEGKIPEAQIANLKNILREKEAAGSPDVPPRPFWIALVHHHPLPLPYDSEHERMMVMGNAGALLHEVTEARIRLILHGHKHHQHFTKVSISAADRPHDEVCVLSAGTPTAGVPTALFTHGFNVIDVHSNERVTVKRFGASARGDAFELNEEFDCINETSASVARFAENREKLAHRCDRLLCIAQINDYGDASFVRHFSRVRACSSVSHGFRDPFPARSAAGVVECVRARAASQDGTDVVALPERVAANDVSCRVIFDDGLRRDHGGIDIAMDFFVGNAYALNGWQLENMYREQPDGGKEFLSCLVPADLAPRELLLHVRFPSEIAYPRRFSLRKKTIDASGRRNWETLKSNLIVLVEPEFIAQARIEYPIPGTTYELRWSIPRNRVVESPAIAQSQRLALELRSALGSSSLKFSGPALGALLQRLTREAASSLTANNTSDIQVAIFGFDNERKVLKYVAGTHAEEDVRKKASYAYGHGPVGRAFKASSVSVFAKPSRSPSAQAWGYILPNGNPVTEAEQVPEAALLAFPLVLKDALAWPYGVLTISTDNPAAQLKTIDTAIDPAVQLFARAVQVLVSDFESLLLGNRGDDHESHAC